MKFLRIFALYCALICQSLAGAVQINTISPNENLVIEGVPPIPVEIADNAERYTNFRGASLLGWSPVHREILISTRFADVAQIHLVRTPGGARRQLTFYPDPIRGAQFNPERDDYFVFSKDTGGGESYQLYRYDVANGGIKLLTDGKSRNTGMLWAESGDVLAYASTRRDGNDVDIWAMNPADPRTDRMLARLNGGGWQALDWSPDGRKLLVMNEISAEESYLWLVDVETGTKTLLTPKGKTKAHYGGGRFSKDTKGIYLTTDKDSEFHRLAYINLDSGRYTYLTNDIPWDIDEFELAKNGKWLAFIANEDGFGVLHVLETATRKQRSIPALPKGVLFGLKWHNNSRDLGFTISSSRSSSDVYSLDIVRGNIDQWTFSENGGLNTMSFLQPELIHWKTWDGRKISGFLYLPLSKFGGKRPVIIDIHGGPEEQFRPTFIAGDNYYLNELGIAMIFPNVRGSSGYGKTFLSLDNGFQREGSYKDIDALLDWIQKQPALDSNRIMVTGGSYGGFMTLAVATNYNGRICCSVDIMGPSNLVTFLERTSGYRRDLRRAEYGDERDPKMRAFLEQIAPYNKAKNITKPMFVVAGQNDPRVPASESQQMVQIVRQNGAPVWWLLAKNEGHGFAKKQNADYEFYATIMFVKKYLLEQ